MAEASRITGIKTRIQQIFTQHGAGKKRATPGQLQGLASPANGIVYLTAAEFAECLEKGWLIKERPAFYEPESAEPPPVNPN